MARRKTRGAGEGVGRAAAGLVRLPVQARVFREGLRAGLRRLGETELGVFREVRLAGAPTGVLGEAIRLGVRPGSARGLCVVLPGGLRIEGLDVEGAAALARLLS